MKIKTLFNLLAISFLVLALGAAHQAQAQGPGAQDDIVPLGVSLGTGFTYQGRLTDNSGNPIAGPCALRFTLYQSAAGNDPVGAAITASGVTTDNGYFSVELDFGANAFDGEGRYLKIEVDCGGGYTTLDPRVKLTPAPYAMYSVSTGALRGNPVSDNVPTAGDVLAWNGSSWLPTGSGAGNAWSLTGNSGATPGTNFLGTTDNQALQLHVNGARALRLEPNATSPNVIGGYSGNSVDAAAWGATIGGGGQSGDVNQVTKEFGTVGGGRHNSAGDHATVSGGSSNNASGYFATVSGGFNNAASDYGATISGGDSNIASVSSATVAGGYQNTAAGLGASVGGGQGNIANAWGATVPGGAGAAATLWGQMAYASGSFSGTPGEAQASLYVMHSTTTSSGAWEDLYLDGSGLLLTIADGRTMTFDILVVGRSNAGESAGYYIWGVAENVGGTTTVWATTMVINEDVANWDAQAVADDASDALLIQVMGNGETIRWVATVRTAEVAW